ncbi:MAG: cell division topological specificity factor MinE [Clostridiales bacterium]|jgi:cell division topological specificity factor|nr:cell division topological specificity factor MinE [Clostridiales bacterium]
MDFFGLFNRRAQSKNVAKDRLKLVLVHDRVNCSADVLEMLKNDILKVMARYMDIDSEELDVQITQTMSDKNEKVPMLIANIPFKNVKPPRAARSLNE